MRVGTVALANRGRPVTAPGTASVFAGFRFPREVISVAVRWYLRYGLSYRDVGELLAGRGITADHLTACRWVLRRPGGSDATWRPRGASSAGRCAPARSRPRSPPAARPPTRGSAAPDRGGGGGDQGSDTGPVALMICWKVTGGLDCEHLPADLAAIARMLSW